MAKLVKKSNLEKDYNSYIVIDTDSFDILGTVLAVLVSWHLNHDVVWAIIHGFFSWWYLVYYAICLT